MWSHFEGKLWTFPTYLIQFNSKTKVPYFAFIKEWEKYVVRFKIQMKKILIMEMLQTLKERKISITKYIHWLHSYHASIEQQFSLNGMKIFHVHSYSTCFYKIENVFPNTLTCFHRPRDITPICFSYPSHNRKHSLSCPVCF